MTGKNAGKLTKGERTSRRILEAAVDCIATIGVERTSITAIAKRAKVSRALVALYFPKKSRIFPEIIERIAAEFYAAMSDAERGVAATSPAEEIARMFEVNLRFFLSRPHYYKCFVLFYYYCSIQPEFRRLNTLMTERAVSRIRDAIARMNGNRSDSVSQDIAESLHAELVGLLLKHYVIEQRSSDPENYVQDWLRRLRTRLSSGTLEAPP